LTTDPADVTSASGTLYVITSMCFTGIEMTFITYKMIIKL